MASSLTSDQIAAAVAAVARWLRTRAQAERGVGEAALVRLAADADHSALLRRLLAGKLPAASPPPLAHSDPWYEVVERDAVEVLHDDVWVDGSGGAARIVINQHAGWDLLDHALDAQGRVVSARVRHPGWPWTWRLSPKLLARAEYRADGTVVGRDVLGYAMVREEGAPTERQTVRQPGGAARRVRP